MELHEQNRVLLIGTKVLFYRVYELSDLNLQKALSITMGDLLLVGEKVIVKLIWERVDQSGTLIQWYSKVPITQVVNCSIYGTRHEIQEKNIQEPKRCLQ